jgi:hypothetical protein
VVIRSGVFWGNRKSLYDISGLIAKNAYGVIQFARSEPFEILAKYCINRTNLTAGFGISWSIASCRLGRRPVEFSRPFEEFYCEIQILSVPMMRDLARRCTVMLTDFLNYVPVGPNAYSNFSWHTAVWIPSVPSCCDSFNFLFIAYGKLNFFAESMQLSRPPFDGV